MKNQIVKIKKKWKPEYMRRQLQVITGEKIVMKEDNYGSWCCYVKHSGIKNSNWLLPFVSHRINYIDAANDFLLQAKSFNLIGGFEICD